MINITIKTNGEYYKKGKSKFGRIVDGKRRALNRRVEYYRRELPLTAATDFRAYLVDIILSQDASYMAGYAPLSARYAASKSYNGFWIKTMDTLIDIESSSVVEIANTGDYTAFTLGLSPRTQQIIQWMEDGTHKMPARPLLGPAFRRFSISFYRQSGTVIRDLIKAWRNG